ncbi:MAG: winged helix-turn-helix domain-containing protein [Chloracidobacterium sp.]|nr:winged helix-turn-helix domain-containing protein [Chloracidobacterium sp.]
MTVEAFLAECAEHNDLSRVMGLFTNSIIEQLTRSAICNRFHTTESRLARWLLMTQDRMRSDDFRITQEILSYMVGVRREAINKSATSFARRNLISYTRGHMSITDRKGLKDIACNCYGMLAMPV